MTQTTHVFVRIFVRTRPLFACPVPLFRSLRAKLLVSPAFACLPARVSSSSAGIFLFYSPPLAQFNAVLPSAWSVVNRSRGLTLAAPKWLTRPRSVGASQHARFYLSARFSLLHVGYRLLFADHYTCSYCLDRAHLRFLFLNLTHQYDSFSMQTWQPHPQRSTKGGNSIMEKGHTLGFIHSLGTGTQDTYNLSHSYP